MRKKIFLLIGLLILVLMGCNKEDGTQDSFIPTISIAPSDIPQEVNKPTEPIATPTQIPEEESEPIIKYVKLSEFGDILNVRSAPTTKDPNNKVGFLVHTEKIEVIEIKDGWASFMYHDQLSYVSAAYLVDERPAPIDPPTATPSPTPIPEPTAVPTPTKVAEPTKAPTLTPTPKPTATPTPELTATPTPTPEPDIDVAKTSIRIFKGDRSLELWNDDNLIGVYSVDLGFSPEGDKKEKGDGKTPEGTYYISSRDDESNYYKSMGISYPNLEDAVEALNNDRITTSEMASIMEAITKGATPPDNTALGGGIMIHGNRRGNDWTDGSIAVDDEVMDILWEYCTIGAKITIYE